MLAGASAEIRRLRTQSDSLKGNDAILVVPPIGAIVLPGSSIPESRRQSAQEGHSGGGLRGRHQISSAIYYNC